MSRIFLSYISAKKDVVAFLDELHRLLSSDEFDTDDVHPPVLFVFGKDISDRLIYVKLKIRDGGRKVVCVSFHYAKRTMLFPYR